MNTGKSYKALLAASLFLSVLLTGCNSGPYNVTFNDNIIYSPNKSLQNSILRDPSLQACLNQVMLASDIKDPAEVTLLACPSSGIETLVGIEALTSLEQLDLSDNNISNINSLLNLKNLRVLSIRNNNVQNIGPLMSLPILRFVALQGNDNISCRQLDNLANKIGNTLNRPLTCD